MERIGFKAHGHEEAKRHDIEQMRAMTPAERFAVAAELQARAYGTDNPDLREAGREYAQKSYLERRSPQIRDAAASASDTHAGSPIPR